MEIRTKNINGKRFEFANEYYETSYSWGHKSTLLINGYERESVKIRYYNRTWECYTYQSVMYKVLEQYKDRRLENYLNNYLYTNGKSRFGKGEKAKVIEEFKKSKEYKEIQKLHKAIELGRYNKCRLFML